MKIVAAPNGTVTRTDRALWLTRPFDIAFASPATGPSEGNSRRWFKGLMHKHPPTLRALRASR